MSCDSPRRPGSSGAHKALLALFAGSLEEAEQLVEAARDLGERTQGWNATVTHRLQLYALRREQNRLGEVEDLIRRSVAEFPTYPIVRCVQTHVLAELGAHDEARAALEALTRGRCAALPFDEEWLVSTCVLADAAVVLGAANRPPCSTSSWRPTTTTSPSATRR